MWTQCIILIIILSFSLFLSSYLFLSSTHNHRIPIALSHPKVSSANDNPDYSIHIGFTASAYEQAKLHETDLQNQYDLTAVLLHWERLEGVQTTLQYLLRTHLFKQIIIWNNNPHINLTLHHLLPHNSSANFVRIINSKDNLKDQAKYRACAEAKTRACFYAGDDWDISHYLKSIIASFRSDPHLLHAVTDAYTFYTNLVWTYFDSSIDLHSGFSWIGCGSVFLRQHAHRHVQFLHKYLQNQTDLIGLSDVFFSVWLNDIPVQFNTNIRDQPSRSSHQSVPFSSTPHFSHLQYTSSVLAIRILEHSLRFDRENNSEVTFPREQNRRFLPYVKSPSFNDNFIFYTNVLPYDMQERTFNISQDFERGTRKNLPRDSNVQYFLQHSTWKAVDDDVATCWHAHREMHSNDFYAIDFLSIQTNLTFTIAVTHSPQIQRHLDVRLSFDGIWWLSYRSQHGVYTKHNGTEKGRLHTFLFDASEFNLGFRSFRYISFKAIQDWDHHFQVCDIKMIPKENMTRIMRDFAQLKTRLF